MFEFHGWATIRDSAGYDSDTEVTASTVRAIQSLIEAENRSNHTADMRWANGELHVWLAGFHNHKDDTVLRAYSRIAEIASGSYGVLYVLDDDDLLRPNQWTRHVMRRGTVVAEDDESLSPHIGSVEDSSSQHQPQ